MAELDLASELAKLEEKLVNQGKNLDVFWLMITGVLVFFMQAGFSMLEAGCVSEKNVNNILFKNLMDTAIAAISFWFFGYAFAYGIDGDGPFIGSANFFLTEINSSNPTDYASFFFQWAFAATAATIVSGAVAERTKLTAYFIYAAFITSVIYPVVAHWVWDADGWLAKEGFIDFAGSGVVHMVGGFTALVGAKAVGPRLGRFKNGVVVDKPGHSNLLASLGVAILWFGWYGFNCGSTLAITGASALASKVAVTTTLSASSAAVAATLLSKTKWGYYNLSLSLNCVLAGLVGITAPCSVVDPWAAIVIGLVATPVYMSCSHIVKMLEIDDPLDAFAVHGGCGLWGVLSVGIFATRENVNFAYGRDDNTVSTGKQFYIQLMGALAIMAWAVTVSAILFYSMKTIPFIGLRVDGTHEQTGLDEAEMGGRAYYYDERDRGESLDPYAEDVDEDDDDDDQPDTMGVVDPYGEEDKEEPGESKYT